MPVQLTAHTGRAVPLRRGDVDTDQIIPAEFCKELGRTGYAKGLFAHWRARPGFVLDEPARAGASILVAGRHFGTGSSREHAVWALRDWGFAAVIAVGYGDIFLRNALKNGLLAVAVDEDAVTALSDAAEADPGYEITVDLARREVRAPGFLRTFDIDERARWLLLNGLDDIAVTLAQDEKIAAYERARAEWLPVTR